MGPTNWDLADILGEMVFHSGDFRMLVDLLLDEALRALRSLFPEPAPAPPDDLSDPSLMPLPNAPRPWDQICSKEQTKKFQASLLTS